MGNNYSGYRYLFGCTNANWDLPPGGIQQPPPATQHEPGNCYAEVSHQAILCWRGTLSVSDALAFKPWVDHCSGGIVATD
jgi:hypothetical protein